MNDPKTHVVLILLMVIVALLMIALVGLFLRMNQLQSLVLDAVRTADADSGGQALGLSPGTRAPGLELVGVDGRPVTLDELAGEGVVLAFTSITCPACTTLYPELKAFGMARPQLRVVMVARGAAADVRRMVEEQQLTFPVLAWEDAVAEAYRVPGTPYIYFIDPQGIILAGGFASTRDQLAALVDRPFR